MLAWAVLGEYSSLTDGQKCRTLAQTLWSVELQATVCRLTLVPASFMLPGVIVEHGG